MAKVKKSDEVIAWKGWRYSVRPFTPRVFFALSEKVIPQNGEAASLTKITRATIEELLMPLDEPSRVALHTGKMYDAVMDAEEAEAAFALMEQLRFFSGQYIERGTMLLTAQKDLDSSILAKPRPSESLSNTKAAPDSSTAVAET